MNKLLSLALALPLMACTIGSDTADDQGQAPPPSGGSGSGSTGGTTSDGTDHITASTTWAPAAGSTTFALTKSTTIDPGVTVTIPAGTTVTLASEISIIVKGTVNVMGATGSPVTLQAATAGSYHNGFLISQGGTLTMTYGVQTGGGIENNGGTVTISDSQLSQTEGDFLVVSAGTVNVQYSLIGVETGTNTTHCDMHFGGNGTTIHINHSNIAMSSYGLMLYGGTNVDLTNNNWFKNTTQIDTTPGVSGDVSGSWFDTGVAPTAGAGATLTASNIATARLTDAGPR